MGESAQEMTRPSEWAIDETGGGGGRGLRGGAGVSATRHRCKRCGIKLGLLSKRV